jgi:nucleotide-binding universal stress UspA family protein
MPTIQQILCPIDFSETSTRAAEQAVAIAGLYGAYISALHVCMPVMMPVPDEPLPEDPLSGHTAQPARDRLAACFGAAKAAGIRVDVLIDGGDPAGDILDRAVQLAPDLIVMGTHGISGVERLVLGSVTEKVLRKATCPVLTVPPHARATAQAPFRQVLCAVDFSDWSLEALKLATSLAQESGAALTIVHVLEWPWHEPPPPAFDDLPIEQANSLRSYRQYLETTALTRVGTLVPDTLPGRISVAPRVCHGKSYVEILRVAAEDQADLIVLGVHGRRAIDVLLLGSTTNQVVRHATCPVLTLRR